MYSIHIFIFRILAILFYFVSQISQKHRLEPQQHYLAPLIAQMHYPEDLTTRDPIQLMTTSLYGWTTTFATIIPQFKYSTWTVSAITWIAVSSWLNTKSNRYSRNGHQHITSPYWMVHIGIMGLPWLSWQTMLLGGE